EWFTCTDPETMIRIITEVASERRERLVAVAAAYRLWEQLPEVLLREGVQLAERRADGLVSPRQVAAFRRRFLDYLHRPRERTKKLYQSTVNRRLLLLVIATNPHVDWCGLKGIVWRGGVRTLPAEALVSIIRDIFGNPFRPVTIDPAWLAWNGGT